MPRGLVGCCVVVAAALLPGGAAPAHAATPPSYVVMFSDGDWVGGGVQRLFHSGNASISVSGTPAYLTVDVAGGTFGDYFDLTFAAPPGQSLVAGGVYVDAQRAPFRSAGRPGIDISGSGRGCNTQAGHFEVKDIGVGASGAITRLWIVYTQFCEGGTRGLWGEVRIGLPTGGAPLVAPGIVRWPAGDVSRPGTVVPVTLVAADAPVTIGAASVVGAAAADFPLRSNECSGKSLTLGSSCQIWVRFVPATAGTRLATLRVADGTGALHEVALQGFAYGGRTRVEMTSDPGDWIGQGKKWTYTIATSEIAMGGGRSYAGFGIEGADGSWWSASFVPGQGDILVAGSTYPNATRYPFNGTGPGLSITGNGRGCNTLTGSFTVTAADFAPDGRLRSAGISFVQHCEGGTPALRGTWEFRAGDNTPLAPWLIGYVPPPPPVTMPPSLVPNGSFEVDLSGWAPTDATATRVVGGAHGNYAARITVAGATKAYGLTVSPHPIQTTTSGVTYVAAASVRSLTPGRRICLVLREWGAAPGLGRVGRSCVTGTGAWQAFTPLSYTTLRSGGSLELAVEQLGPNAGDSFDLDGVSLLPAAEAGVAASEPEDAAGDVAADLPGAASSKHILGSGLHALVL